MKFDLIVGNPPFQKTADHGKKISQNLWVPITFMSWSLLREDGVLCLITPSTWRTLTNDDTIKRRSILRDILKPYRTLSINMNELKRHFPGVGSTFSQFIVQKTLDDANITDAVTLYGNTTLDLNEMRMIPFDLSDIGLSIFNKITTSSHPRWNMRPRSSKKTKDLDVSDIKDKNHPYRHFSSHGAQDMQYCNRPGTNHFVSKIVVSRTGEMNVSVDNGDLTPGNECHIQVLRPEELSSAESQFKSMLFNTIMNTNKSNQYIDRYLLNFLPQLDMTRDWTDTEIYSELNLTEEEVAYIEPRRTEQYEI
jgi:hypothetical protein